MGYLSDRKHAHITVTTTAAVVTIGSGIAFTVYALSTRGLFFVLSLTGVPAIGGLVCGWHSLGIVGAAKTGAAPVGVFTIVGLIGEIVGGSHGEGAPVLSLVILFMPLAVVSSLVGFTIGAGTSVLFDHLSAGKG